MPRSFLFFALTGVIFLLQYFPATGVFLMIFAGLFWSIVTVNLGFVGLAVEALTGNTSRLWLLAPIVWFGGYGVAAIANHFAAEALIREVDAHNARQSLVFDPASSALVFADSNLRNATMGIVAGYRVPVAYEASRGRDVIDYIAFRLGRRDLCGRIANDATLRAAQAWTNHVRELDGSGCVYRLPEAPQLPQVTVTSRFTRHAGFWLYYEINRVRVADTQGHTIELLQGHVRPWSWLPMPIIGCALGGQSEGWRCMAEFWRGDARPLGGDTISATVARSLGLSRTSSSEALERADATLPPAHEAIGERRLELSLANLDRIIADPSARLTVHDLAGLPENPALYASRAQAMVTTLGRALDGGERTRERGWNLQRLLSRLEPEDFARHGPSVLTLFEARPTLNPYLVTPEILTRLGDLGAPALPVLERFAAQRGEGQVGAVLGLCRIGEAAAATAERLRDVLLSAAHNHHLHEAAFVALMRIGRGDLVPQDLGPSRRHSQQLYDEVRQRVTPDSRPDMCVLLAGWRRALAANG